MTQELGDGTGGRRSRLQAARDPALLAAGAVLLMCASVLPGLSRVVVLPALLLAPGYALLRLLGQAGDWRSVSIAIPVSFVLVVCASLVLDVSGIPISPLSLGLFLGAATALFVAGSYRRRPIGSRAGLHRRPLAPRDRDLARRDATVDEGKVTFPR
jgi:hypothetical protein